jgi:alpha-tubulin suppressor-like RCC1 family protein
MNNPTITAATSGRQLFLAHAGKVWGCGDNTSGQLGHKDALMRNTFDELPFDNVAAVASSVHHTLVVDTDGVVWGAGRRDGGQLATWNGADQTHWERMPTDDIGPITAVAAHGRATWLVNRDGDLWGCGQRQFILAERDNYPEWELHPAATGRHLTAISAAGHHLAGIDDDGTLWTCGAGQATAGAHGHDDGWSHTRLDAVGTLLVPVVAVDCGEYHTIAIGDDGSVWAAGSNVCGQLGLPHASKNRTSFTRVPFYADAVTVACGATHTLIGDSDGNVWSAGDNTHGQLGCPQAVVQGLTLAGHPGPGMAVAAGGNLSVAVGNNAVVIGGYLDTITVGADLKATARPLGMTVTGAGPTPVGIMRDGQGPRSFAQLIAELPAELIRALSEHAGADADLVAGLAPSWDGTLGELLTASAHLSATPA